MKTHYINYNFEKSLERLDNILDAADSNFEEVDTIPSRDKLTFTNGFYVNVSALFVDIRDSSSLTEIHRRPTLAKIYRAYISEIVAILNGNSDCVEINIVGDCVSGIFETIYKSDIDNLVNTAAKINSLINILNCKLKKNNITTIKTGIGISDGRALMIKAGYKGSEINEIVWMGNAVNEASKLANNANTNFFNEKIMISNKIYDDLEEQAQNLFNKNNTFDCYHGNVIWSSMNDWYNENCE